MGTNYYARKPPEICECCGHEESFEKHIGKSSMGWCFSLHVYPEEGIRTLEDWFAILGQEGYYIENEYGEIIPPEHFKQTVTERASQHDWSKFDVGGWYKDEAHFHERNHSERGPNYLLRHKIGDHCIGHGEGTWDYIVGEFS